MYLRGLEVGPLDPNDMPTLFYIVNDIHFFNKLKG